MFGFKFFLWTLILFSWENSIIMCGMERLIMIEFFINAT